VPDAAIKLMQGQPTVFVYEHGVYGTRVVDPGERLGGNTVVKSGLQAGEQVVTTRSSTRWTCARCTTGPCG
jgi:cobalt-zinc-cadmium efflux system membrane fusion protein